MKSFMEIGPHFFKNSKDRHTDGQTDAAALYIDEFC